MLCDCINSHGQTDSGRREEWKVGGADNAAAVLKGISVKNGLVARNKDLSPSRNGICLMVSGNSQEAWKEGEADVMGTGGLSRSSSLPDLLSHLLGMFTSFLFLDRMIFQGASSLRPV